MQRVQWASTTADFKPGKKCKSLELSLLQWELEIGKSRKIWKLKFITKIKKMKKDRCPAYFPIFWLKQWLKKCTVYWDRTQEEGWLWRSVCVCSMCGVCVYVVYVRGEKKGILYLVTDMLIWKHVWDVSNLEISSWLLNLWACCLELGPHLFTSRSYWSWETLTLNGHIWGDKPAGNSERRNESDRKKR